MTDDVRIAFALGPNEAERLQAEWRHLQAQIRLAERQASWEPWKALAAIIAAAAIMSGAVLTLSSWRAPQTINVHLDAPLTTIRDAIRDAQRDRR